MGTNEKKLCRCSIYQLKDDEDARLFMPYDRFMETGQTPVREDYRLVYSEDIKEENDIMAMDSLYEKLNVELPPYFTGHTPSMSDVIEVTRNGSDRWYYIDRIGFRELEEFAENAKRKETGEEKIYLVPVTYEVYGRVPVKAASPRAAYEWANEHIDEIKLPTDASYLEDSFEVDGEGIIIDEEGNVYDPSDDC